MTSALLKLPQTLSRIKKEERVEQILEELVGPLTWLTCHRAACLTSSIRNCLSTALHSHVRPICRYRHDISGMCVFPVPCCRRKGEGMLTGRLCTQELQAVKNNMIGEDVDGAVSGISGGERRRVSVGIGLVTDARAIFLDEPTTGLDSDSAEQLIALLSHLAAHKHRSVSPSPTP